MKNIIFILAIVFFVSECNADSRVLEQLKSQAHHRAKASVSKNKKPKKTVMHKKIVLIKTKPKEIITLEELDIRDDLAYLPNKDTPFTGRHQMHHSNGKKHIETKYKDGKKDGSLIMWDEYEHKVGEIIFKDGSQF